MNKDNNTSKSKKQITMTVNGEMLTRGIYRHMTLAEFHTPYLRLNEYTPNPAIKDLQYFDKKNVIKNSRRCGDQQILLPR